MAFQYFDTSALLKKYLAEPGSDRVRELTADDSGETIYVVRVTRVELASAATRRQRKGDLSEAELDAILAAVAGDMEQRFDAVELTPGLTDEAAELARRHGLRAYDAVQLAGMAAIAVTGAAVTFVCCDAALLAAATAGGLATENPA